ncbi:hypothetical protein, partial [Dyadobacter sp. CY323]|uniref:hypothetical protein n=1 Tax=Dyadobacter sp. CY323 TaxID=2907302 RepID=UPI001F48AB34
AGIKRITINLADLSTSGSSLVMIQIGDSGGIETTGYKGASSTISSGSAEGAFSTGFVIYSNVASGTDVRHGSIVLSLVDAATNTWVAAGVIGLSNATRTAIVGGSKALSAMLDRLLITTVGGTDTFDAGLINILYE